MNGCVTWDRGIGLPGPGLWLDPPRRRGLAFVSHAHSDHARRHDEAILTPATLALSAGKRRPRRARVLDYGVETGVGEATLTLWPAGHMLGSAQLLLDQPGLRILYTGDLKLVCGAGRPRTQVPRCDVLVMESTYGQPRFRFPDPDAAVEGLALWCRRQLRQGITPVLLANALGKTQELMLALAPFGFSFALESRCLEHAAAYRRAGAELPDFIPLEPSTVQGRVALAPPAGKAEVRRLGRRACALVSGWALDEVFWRRAGAETAFPVSDHCDFSELLEVVEAAQPSFVYTVHGFAEDLARQLRRRGVKAAALARNQQLDLF